MVSLQVYSKCAKIKYRSTVCSKATFFIVILTIISVLLPFFLAYNSRGFWLKRDTFYEQPNVKYKHEYVFIAETDKINSPILCSNIFNFYENGLDKCTMIKIREIDQNEDSKTDILHFRLTATATKIYSVTLLLTLDYKIHTVCPLQMQSAVILQNQGFSPATEMYFIGDVVLSQSFPLPCHSKKIYTDFNHSVINTDRPFHIQDIISDYFVRNVSTKVDNAHVTWISGISSVFTVDILLRYPEQMIFYKPNFWQVIKFAWVQYLSIFILISWLVNKVRDYVFTNKLVLYYLDSSDKKKL